MAAYRRNPYDIDVLNALGVIYDHLGRRDLAFRYFERALALDTFSPMTLNNLGRCWMNDGNWRHAIDYLERAEKMDDSNGQIAANLRTAKIEAARTWAANSTRVRAATGMRIERQNSVVQVLYTRPDEQRPERPGLIEESEKFSAPSSFGPHPGAPDENAASEAVASGNGAVVRRRTPDRRGS